MSMGNQIGQGQTEMNAPEQPSRTTRLGNYIIYVALIILALAVSVFLYWSFQPSDVIDIHRVPIPVRTIREHPTADGVVILDLDYCKKVSATGRVRVSFVNSSREIFLPAGVDKQPPLCAHQEFPVLIPHDIPAGRYKVRFRSQYQINPIKSTVEEFDSLEFEVAESEG